MRESQCLGSYFPVNKKDSSYENIKFQAQNNVQKFLSFIAAKVTIIRNRLTFFRLLKAPRFTVVIRFSSRSRRVRLGRLKTFLSNVCSWFWFRRRKRSEFKPENTPKGSVDSILSEMEQQKTAEQRIYFSRKALDTKARQNFPFKGKQADCGTYYLLAKLM